MDAAEHAPSREACASPATLTGYMRRTARDADHGVTLVRAGREERVVYRDLFGLVDRIAAGLGASGVVTGDRVIVVLPQGFELMAAFLACMAIGAVPSILPPVSPKQDPRLYWRDIDTLLARIRARMLVTFEAYRADAAAFIEAAGVTVAMASELAAAGGDGLAWREPDPGEVAFLQHSSGTTAVKKGVMITHAGATAQLDAYARTLALRPDDRVVSWLPLYHDMGLVACFLLPVMLGLDLVLLDTFEWVVAPGLLLEAAQAHRATLAWLPNFAFQHICDATARERRFDLSSLRAVINCSETCRPETMAGFVTRFADCGLDPHAVQACYAMAETVFAISQTEVGEAMRTLDVEAGDLVVGERPTIAPSSPGVRRLAACGRPIDGVELRVLDAAGAPLDAGRVGQIAVRAPFLFSGYYELEEATAAAFADGWFLTGDLGLVWDGEVYVTGRLKDMLIIHGKNIMAHDVEAAIAAVEGVKPGRVIALGVFDPRAGSDNLEVVVELEGAAADTAPVKRAVRNRVVQTLGLSLSRVHVAPAGWIVKSTSGKLNRKENLEKFHDNELGALLA